jgi:hypothetical protein
MNTFNNFIIPKSVFPVPGGPNKRMPLGGARRPVKMSGLNNGNTTTSLTIFFTNFKPATSFHSVGLPLNKISEIIDVEDRFQQGAYN